MNPFNLEEYNTNPSRKVVKRGGAPVRIVCTDAKGDYPVVALAIDEDGSEYTIRCTQYGISGIIKDDLFFSGEKKEGFVNVYIIPDTDLREVSCIFDTKEDAEFYRGANYVATTKIEWEE